MSDSSNTTMASARQSVSSVTKKDPLPSSDNSTVIPSLNASALSLSKVGVVEEKNLEGQVEQKEEQRAIQGVKWALIVIAIMSCIFLNALDFTIVAVIIPNLVKDLGSVEKIPWMSLSFTLAGTALILPLSKIYGVFNIKWLYISNVFLFLVGSAICGAANTMNTEIAGRVIAGVGGCSMYLGCLTFLSVLTTGKERPTYIGLTGLVWGGGVVLGPLVGGGFHDSSAGWRWAFYINLFIGGACMPVYIWLLPSINPQPDKSTKQKLKDIDWLGTVLIAAALTLLISALVMGGVAWSWSSAQSITFFVLGFVLLAAFAVVETFTIFTTLENRLYPVHFLKSRTMIILSICTACAATICFVPVNYIPLIFQFTRGDKAIIAAVRLLPLICVLIAATVVSGYLMSRIGLYKPLYVLGAALSLAGGALAYTITSSTPVEKIYGYTILLGAGSGLFIQNSFAVAQGSVLPSEIPFAIGFILIAQMVGGSVALAVAGTIFVNKSVTGLASLFPQLSHKELEGAISGVGSRFIMELRGEMRERALEKIVEGLSGTFATALAAGAFAFVVSLFMKWERLRIESAAPL